MTLEQQLTANYADVRRRLWGEPPKRKPPALVAPKKTSNRQKRVTHLADGISKKRFQVSDRRLAIIEAGAFKLIPEFLEWQKITNQVTRETGVSYKEMCSDRRTDDIVGARRLAWYRIKIATGYSNGQISRKFGRDISTVFTGIERHCLENGLEKPS